MKYYKLLSGHEFIGAVTSGSFVKENPINGWLLTSNENEGQFVEYGGQLYRDYWMQPVTDNRIFSIISILEITEEEYNRLTEAIHNNEEPIYEEEIEEEDIEIPVEEEQEPDIILEFLRDSKIKQMSNICRKTIENGFDLELRGESYHFSLDTQDQLNLMSLSTMAQTQSLIPYHADGEACVFYTAEEIKKIIETATTFKIYHTAYYNSLKAYIKSLQTEADISAIEYGVDIPEIYKSDVLKVLSV